MSLKGLSAGPKRSPSTLNATMLRIGDQRLSTGVSPGGSRRTSSQPSPARGSIVMHAASGLCLLYPNSGGGPFVENLSQFLPDACEAVLSECGLHRGGSLDAVTIGL